MVVKPLQPTKEKTVGVRSKLLGKGTSFSQAFFFNKKLYFIPVSTGVLHPSNPLLQMPL
jgi:hypothetical protein